MRLSDEIGALQFRIRQSNGERVGLRHRRNVVVQHQEIAGYPVESASRPVEESVGDGRRSGGTVGRVREEQQRIAPEIEPRRYFENVDARFRDNRFYESARIAIVDVSAESGFAGEPRAGDEDRRADTDAGRLVCRRYRLVDG